jgi:23S rRNA pseudouridine1911/1915/1917 synthase
LEADDDYGRVDAFLSANVPHLSRSQIQKLIRQGACSINGEPCRARDQIQKGDRINLQTVGVQKPSPLATDPRPIPLEILYEDQDLIIVNKAAGLVVHPGAGTHEPTLVEGLLAYWQASHEDLPGPMDRPGVVHRLDKDTSGAMVVCKTAAAHEHLARQFRDKTNEREYVALLNGLLEPEELTMESILVRDERHRLRYKSVDLATYRQLEADGKAPAKGRYAKTEFFKKVTYNHRLTLSSVRLSTGRTHQIRVHAQALKVPVWGDPLYGFQQDLPKTFPEDVRQALVSVRRQLLHARKLGFEHPRTGEAVVFTAPLPQDFRKILEILKQYGQFITR